MFSSEIKTSRNGDEYYTPQNVVDMIVPYVISGGFTTIWCPFDKKESKFVQTFKNEGFDVVYGHIDTGQDFFNFDKPQGDIVVSNPPFSKRDKIVERLFSFGVPFALVMNFNGLFDSKKRARLFSEHDFEILVPFGRMKFTHKDKGQLNSPNFQSVYLCSKLLDKQIVFSGDEF